MREREGEEESYELGERREEGGDRKRDRKVTFEVTRKRIVG